MAVDPPKVIIPDPPKARNPAYDALKELLEAMPASGVDLQHAFDVLRSARFQRARHIAEAVIEAGE